MTTAFTLQNLTCASCVKLCTKKFKKLDGVEDVHIDLATGASSINATRALSLDELASALIGTHYTVSPLVA